MVEPLVSVNMCVWRPNRDYFRTAVSSVLAQTFEAFELIIVEDPSEIDGRSLLGELSSDQRVVYVTNRERTGLVAQRNKALSLSRGEYVAFLDADDYAEPVRLEKQVEWLCANTTVSFVGTWISLMDENGKIFGLRRYPCSSSAVTRAMEFYCAMAFPSVMCRRVVVEKLGGFRGGSFVTDYDLWCRAVGAGYLCDNIPEPLVRYRVHSCARTRKYVRRVLYQTVKTKIRNFGPRLSFQGYLRILTEIACLVLPANLVDYVFRCLTFEQVKTGSGE